MSSKRDRMRLKAKKQLDKMNFAESGDVEKEDTSSQSAKKSSARSPSLLSGYVYVFSGIFAFIMFCLSWIYNFIKKKHSALLSYNIVAALLISSNAMYQISYLLL